MTTLQDRAHDKAAERFTADPMPTQEEAFGLAARMEPYVWWLGVLGVTAILIGVLVVLPLHFGVLK